MSSFGRTPPAYYWVVTGVATVWELIGCYFCYMQFKLGADAMPGATEYDRALMASMPGWYNWVYAVAVGAGALGGIALLLRKRVARPLFVVSLVACLIQFGYYFATTDAIAVNGPSVVGFPILITVLGGFFLWFADRAAKRGWLH